MSIWRLRKAAVRAQEEHERQVWAELDFLASGLGEHAVGYVAALRKTNASIGAATLARNAFRRALADEAKARP